MNGAPVKSKNFRHDENIIGDPNRVYSWTKTTNGGSHAGKELSTTDYIASTNEIMTGRLSVVAALNRFHLRGVGVG